MKALDPILDNANDKQVAQYIDDDDRNYLAFLELSNYEKLREFLYVHPILKGEAKENELEILRKTNPTEFTHQMLNAQKSIERYTSRLNLKKYRDDAERNDWARLIETYSNKLKIMQNLISK